MEILETIAQIVTSVAAIAGALVVLVKPLRERLFHNRKANDGDKCLLRTAILNIYYKGLDKKELHQYEAENLVQLYEAYKALGGNSFIDCVYEDMRTWTVTR